MRRFAATWLLLTVLSGPVGLVFATEADEPRLMLDRMSTAMSQMNYQGTFVYIQGDEVETMRITHVSDKHGVRERLIAISGPPREILRDSNGVRWVLAEDYSVFEDQGYNRSFFPELPVDQHGSTEVSYSLKVGKETRIAGHQARNLKVVPRDKYRYGYDLWLEEHSGLLLKWELIGSDRKPIAKLMFTDIRLGSEVDLKELEPTSQLKKFKTVESRLPSGRGYSSSAPTWKPGSLPPGFRLMSHRTFGEQDQGVYEHLVFSDGLAAVSVYIENIKPDIGLRTGMSRLGTTHAFSRITDDMLITVVGDVPVITVKFIGDSVKIAAH
jgi:sigma-E factor negative regulatory protein RseB